MQGFFLIIRQNKSMNYLFNPKIMKLLSVIILGVFTFINTMTAFALSAEEVNPLKDPDFYKELPVGDVDVYAADNSWATVVYFPQYHKSPGSNFKNKKNDKAEITQNEIYKVIKELLDELPIRLVMVEGKLKGEVSQAEKAKVQNKIEDLKNLKEKTNSENKIKEKKREISLMGAPIKLWAEGQDMILVGSENKDTLEQSREIVKEHINLENQLASLGKNKISTLEDSFNDQTLKKLQKLKELKAKLKNKKTGGTPENKAKLKEKLKKNEEKIKEVIIDKRNHETAENFSQALKKYDQNIGILEYGAGHEEGLVKEFNKLGIDVIVVKTNEVKRLKK